MLAVYFAWMPFRLAADSSFNDITLSTSKITIFVEVVKIKVPTIKVQTSSKEAISPSVADVNDASSEISAGCINVDSTCFVE